MSFDFKDVETQKMKLADLKPAAYNPRKISDKSLTGLNNSMERFGNLVPIVWNKRSNNIVGGHQRYRLLVEAGETETDVVVVDLDGNEEVALNIALNSRELRGDFTSEILKQLELCEVRMGDAFSDVGLMDLFKLVKKLKFDDIKSPLKPLGKETDGKTGDNQTPTDVIDGPDAIITCPKCKSKFKMKDNTVVVNNFKDGDKTDV